MQNNSLRINLKNWEIQSCSTTKLVGEQISTASYNPTSWYKAQIPATILSALIQNKVYKNVYFSDNLKKIPTVKFDTAWWYHTNFYLSKADKALHQQLIFEGINYKAEIWLNGSLIADSSQVEGAFNSFSFDITNKLKLGKNSLAVKIYPPKKGDLTIGFVDWNPPAPDQNMGIWRPVYIQQTGNVAIDNVFVQSKVETKTSKSANLYISAQLKNFSTKPQEIELKGEIGTVDFVQNYKLKPNEVKSIKLNPEKIPSLHFINPKLWWPNNMGKPNLYNLELKLKIKNTISDYKKIRFGIREIGQYFNAAGHRGYTINGKKILIRGGGWVDDLLLADDSAKIVSQIRYAKEMHLNTIRMEGFWGNSETIYNQCDEQGILLMLGWSCHWEWEDYCGRPDGKYMSINSQKDRQLQIQGYKDQVNCLRNHPSIFVWIYGSDKLPSPKLERDLNSMMAKSDSSRPILAACKYKDFEYKVKKGKIISGYINNSELSGPTGVKMLGPYAYVTPNYWYIDKERGGAYGFNTETGPGPQIPTLSSLKKMLPQADLWPIDSIWNYHCGRHEFQTLNFFLNAFNKRYGKSKNITDFAYRVQISNYEAIRAMYEAFAVNKFTATGVITWMLNSAWPEMFWQLYDWYLMPTGAYFGTLTACKPLHLIYNYGNKYIYISNETLNLYKNLIADIKIFDLNSKIIFSDTINFSIQENKAKLVYKLPKIKNLTKVYFLNLNLLDSSEQKINTNFYWLSTKKDVPDFNKSEWFKTPNKAFADFSALKNLPKAQVTSEIIKKKGNIEIKLKNKSNVIAFFIALELLDKNTGKNILPVFWSDNYVSLLPHQERIIKVKFKETKTIKPQIKLKGLNL